MKIRKGYVSNSSSSSFCVLGIYKPEDYDEYELTGGGLINYHYGIDNYYKQIILGASPESMKEDETLHDFKTRICEMFSKNGIEVKVEDLQWFLDGGYDG